MTVRFLPESAMSISAGLVQLTQLLTRHCSHERATQTPIGGLTLLSQPKAEAPFPIVIEPLVCVVVKGSKQVFIGAERYQYSPATFLLVSGEAPAMAQVTAAPYLGLQLTINPVAVGELVPHLPNTPGEPSRAWATSPLADEILDPLVRLVALLDAPTDRAVLEPLIKREILWRLLRSREGSGLRQIVRGNSHGQRIVGVLRQLRRDLAQPLRVDELARTVGMSVRSFHRHFKTVTTFSPLQYQKQLRLQEARRLMLTEALDAASAAYQVGYESASQFNREYHRMFGRPPRRDVARFHHSP